jgi:hypothetical protein
LAGEGFGSGRQKGSKKDSNGYSGRCQTGFWNFNDNKDSAKYIRAHFYRKFEILKDQKGMSNLVFKRNLGVG